MQKRSKRHHFVPKALQKAFRTKNDQIWYATRRDGGEFSTPELRNIDTAFYIKDLYTVLAKDGALSDEVEREFYGKIDNYIGKVVQDALMAFERGEVPVFSGDALISIQLVIFELIKRTPDFFGRSIDIELGADFVESMLENSEIILDKKRLKYFEEARKNQSELVKLGRNIRVKGLLKRSDRVDEALKDFSVKWAVVSGRSSFILSSQIAYRIGNGGSNGLANPKMEIWLPISPKHALVLVRDRNNAIPTVVPESDTHVRIVNEYATRTSSFIASHSEKLLLSLIRTAGIKRED